MDNINCSLNNHNNHNNQSSAIDFVSDDSTPVTLSRIETIVHLICLSQGIPINLLIGFVIARNRRLHNPRNAFWLGIIAFNLITMLMAVLKLIVVHVGQTDHDDFTCLIFSFMTGKPYTILLVVMLLATLDRYVAITYPLYHREHVTVRLVVYVQIGIFFTVFFLLSIPHIFNWIPLSCGFNLTLGKWTMLLRSILVIMCITAQVKVYLITRRYLRQPEVQPLAIPLQQLANTVIQQNRDDHPQPSGTAAESTSSLSVNNLNKNAPFFVHRRNKTVSKLELEASLTLVVGVLSLCVVTTPMFVVYFSLSICQQVGGECAGLSSMAPYVRQAALIHAVYGPLIYMIRSREFASAIRKILRPHSARLDDVNYF